MADFSTYAGRQAYRDSHPGVVVDASGASDGATNSNSSSSVYTASAPAQSAPSMGGGGGGSYNTINGTQTVASMAAQLKNAGWGGNVNDPAAVAAAYASTTGGPVTGGGGGGGAGGGTDTGGGGGGGLSQAQKDAQAKADILAGAAASAGMSLAELAERKRQFDIQLEWTKQMWANQGLPELQIKQQAQALAQQEFEQQKLIANANLALAQKTQAAQESQFGATMGMDYLKQAASMGGPSDYFQQSNFLRGASANPAVPGFLQSLQNNTGMAAFNAPSGAAPGVQSMQGLVSGLTGGVAPINQQNALNVIGGIGARGAQALGPQALEQLNPDELALFGSGMKASGFSMPSFLQSYAQSRIGQQGAQAA